MREKGPGLHFAPTAHVGPASGEDGVVDSEWVFVDVDGDGDVTEKEEVTETLSFGFRHRPWLQIFEVAQTECLLNIRLTESDVKIIAQFSAGS